MNYDIKYIGDMHPEKGSPIDNSQTHHTKLIHTLRSST